MVFQAGDSIRPLIVLVPNWITSFSELVAYVSTMTGRAFSLGPSKLLGGATARSLNDPDKLR
jgi:hypothetical protein